MVFQMPLGIISMPKNPHVINYTCLIFISMTNITSGIKCFFPGCVR